MLELDTLLWSDKDILDPDTGTLIRRQDVYTITEAVMHNLSLTYTLKYVTRLDQLQEATEWVKSQKYFGLDFETSGLNPFKEKVATVQVGNPFATEPIAYVADVRAFTPEEFAPFMAAISDGSRKKLGQNIKFECKFSLSNFGVNIWNVADTQVSEMIIRAGLLPRSNVKGDEDDRMAAYGAASMGALARRHLGITIKKELSVRTGFYSTPVGQHNIEQLAYAAGDVIYIFYIAREQQKEIVDRQLENIIKIEHGLVPILAAAEHRGMGMNPDAWLDLWQEAVAGRMQAEIDLHKMLHGADQLEFTSVLQADYKMLYPRTGKAVNFSSPVQLKYAVSAYCKAINWPIKLVTDESELVELKKVYGKDFYEWRKKTNKNFNYADVPDYVIPADKYCVLTSTNADELRLARLQKQLPRDLVTLLLEYAKYDIRETTFGKDFLTKYLHPDGRVHTEFHQAISQAGRFSASPNLMNIPRDDRYRKAFIPTQGYSFVIADYSQIEPRLTAQESQDPVYLSTFASGDDIYLTVAESMLGHRPDKNTEQGALERQIFKIIVLAMAYRMGPPKLQRKLALSLEKEILDGKAEFPTFNYVKGLHKQFLETFDKLHDFQKKCSFLADPRPDTGEPRTIWDKYLNAEVTWITALCGRKRFFPLSANNTYTEAANAPIQGCSATITKAAMVMIQKEIFKQGFDAHLINVVHDELIYECADAQAEAFAKVMKECMEKAGQFYTPSVPIIAEFPKNTKGVVSSWIKEGPKVPKFDDE